MPKASQEAYMSLVAKLGQKAALCDEVVAALKSLNTAAIEFQVYRDLVGGCIGEQVQAVLAKVKALEEPAPEPETWERLLVDLAEDTRLGMVDIVAESTLHGLVNTLWGLEARKRLAWALVEAKP